MTRHIIETHWDPKNKAWRARPPNTEHPVRQDQSPAHDWMREGRKLIAMIGVGTAIAIGFALWPQQEDWRATLAPEQAQAHRQDIAWEQKFGCTLGAGTTLKHWGVYQGNIDLDTNPQLWREDGTISLVAVKAPWDEASFTWLFPHSMQQTKAGIVDHDSRADLYYILLPTQTGWTPERALQEFRRTGRHCGVFENKDAALDQLNTLNER